MLDKNLHKILEQYCSLSPLDDSPELPICLSQWLQWLVSILRLVKTKVFSKISFLDSSFCISTDSLDPWIALRQNCASWIEIPFDLLILQVVCPMHFLSLEALYAINMNSHQIHDLSSLNNVNNLYRMQKYIEIRNFNILGYVRFIMHV